MILSLLATFFFPKKMMAIDFFDDLGLALDAGDLIEPPDSLNLPDLRHDWQNLLKGGRLKWQDERVKYPRFVDLCLRVYRKVYFALNSYDPAWVGSTGKSGKVRLVSDNWLDVYDFRFGKTPLVMTSHVYTNLGIQANYGILSLSYSVDLNTLFNHHSSKHRKFSFNISTARLFAQAYFWENSGGSVIRRVGSKLYLNRHRDVPFDGLSFHAAGVMGFYTFNSKRFSFAAPYELSNYQLRSAGSWLAGVSGTFYKADFDFSELPQNVLDKLNFPFQQYSLDYNSVNLLGGYSFNWVCNKHFLFNTTTLPGFGVSFSFSNSTTGRKDLFSATIRQMLSLTYTNREFFVTGNSMFHGNMLPTGDLAFLSGIINFQISTGVRF